MTRALSTIALIMAGLVLPAPVAAQAPTADESADEAAQVDAALGSAKADASADGPEPASRRVAVVALGEGTKSGSVMETLLNLLDDDGFEVVEAARLRRLIGTSLVPQTPPEISRQFVGLSTRIGRGIEKFFYKGNEAALQILTPVFNLGMAHPEVLARRPDFARQIFEAGLVMIRAYKNLERADDARRLARALVETFPGFDARANSVPPAIVKLLADQRRELADSGRKMTVRMILGEGCQALVNGTEVTSGPFAVAAQAEYFVTMECGGGEAPLWRVEPSGKGKVEIPIATIHPLDYNMPTAGFRHRKQAEAYLQMVAFWAGVPRVLGVADAEGSDTSESVVLVHMGPDGEAGWSDRADEKTVSRMLLRVMNDFGGRPVSKPQGQEAFETGESFDWFSWSLVGAGVLMTGAGTYGLIASDVRADELRCSPDVNSGATAAECDGVATLRFANSREYDSAKSELNTVRALSGIGLAAGLGMASWGVYRLTVDQEPPPGRRVRWGVGVAGNSAHLVARIPF